MEMLLDRSTLLERCQLLCVSFWGPVIEVVICATVAIINGRSQCRYTCKCDLGGHMNPYDVRSIHLAAALH